MFSIPYALSVLLHEKRFDFDILGKPYIDRSDIMETTKCIKIEVDPKWDSEYPEKRGATMVVKLKNGSQFEESKNLPYGEPETMYSNNMLVEKFFKYAKDIIQNEMSQELLKTIQSLEQQRDVNSLTKFLGNIYFCNSGEGF